jgi:hypothetical protein
LFAGGYSLAVSIGLFCVALWLDEPLVAVWGAVAAAFYLVMIIGSPRVLRTRERRWWFLMAALLNAGICAFGQLLGFILYGPALLTFVAMFVLPYGLSRRYTGSAERRQKRRIAA